MKTKTIISVLALILSVGFLKAQSQQDISRPATENPLPANHLEVPKPAATTAVVKQPVVAHPVQTNSARRSPARQVAVTQSKPAANQNGQAATAKPAGSK